MTSEKTPRFDAAALRALLSGPASREQWETFCDAVPRFSLADLAPLVPELREALARWPEAVPREAPELWALACPAALSLATTLDLHRPDAALLHKLQDGGHLAALRSLSLYGVELDEDFFGFARRAELPALRSLAVVNSRMKPPALEALLDSALAARLSCLSLGYNRDLGEESLALLSRPRSQPWQGLDLSATGFSDAALRSLARSPALAALRALRLEDNELTEPALVALARSPRAAKLRHLELSFNSLGDEGALALAESPRLAQLRRLGLAHCELTAAGVRSLARSPQLAGLRQLRLGVNRVGKTGVVALCKSTFAASLEGLDLAHAKLDANAVNALARGPFPSLRELELRHNELGDGALLALLESPLARELRELDLRNTSSSGEALRALARADVAPNLRTLQWSAWPALEGEVKGLLAQRPGLRSEPRRRWDDPLAEVLAVEPEREATRAARTARESAPAQSTSGRRAR